MEEIKYGKSPIEYAKKHIARQKIMNEVREACDSITKHGRQVVEDATLTKEDMEFIDKG